MRILGLDVGDRTIGVAASDELGWIAHGITVIRRSQWDEDLQRLRELVQEYEITLIVVGYPKNMNGTIGPRAEMAAEFAEKVAAALSLPFKLWDERLTTMEAERTLLTADVSRAKRKKVIDKLAAVLILQNYLQAQANRPSVYKEGKLKKVGNYFKKEVDKKMIEINDDIVKLLDEEGQEHSFIVLTTIEVKENKYTIMIPVEDELSELDEQEAIIFRIDENDGEQMLTVVEEGDEWEAVAEAWEKMSDIDDYDEDDDEEDDDEDEEEYDEDDEDEE